MVIFIACTVFICLEQKLNLYHKKKVYKDLDFCDVIMSDGKIYNKVQSKLKIYRDIIPYLFIS